MALVISLVALGLSLYNLSLSLKRESEVHGRIIEKLRYR